MRAATATGEPQPAVTPRAPGSFRFLLPVALVVVAARVPLLTAGADGALSLMADDASYYLEAARRTIEQPGWPSLDGRNPTNGWHPLYFGAVAALQAVVGTAPQRVLPAVLALNLALNAAAVLVLAMAVRARLGGRAGLVAAMALGVNPGWLAHGLAGVENSLSSLLLLFAALRWLRRFDPPDAEPPLPMHRGWWWDGCLLGLSVLGRTDAVIFAACYAASALLLRRRHERLAPVVRDLAACTLAAIVVVSPWLFLNYWRFGTIVQDSALALHARFDGSAALVLRNLSFWAYRLAWAWGIVPLTGFLIGCALPIDRLRRMGGRGDAAWPAVVLVCACVAALSIRANDPWFIDNAWLAAAELGLGLAGLLSGLAAPRTHNAFAATTHAFLWSFVLLLTLAYSTVLGSFQLWYTTAPILAAILVLTLPALAQLLQRQPHLALIVGVLLAVQAGARVQGYLTRGAFEGMQPRVLEEGAVLRSRLEQAAADTGLGFGSFDSGELSYRVHPFPIANLDGVMNHGAAQALSSHTLAAYMRAAGITHVLGSADRVALFARLGRFAARSDPALSAALGVPAWRVAPAP